MALSDVRTAIDALDDEILRLLNERAKIAEQVALAKRDADLPSYDPRREAEVIARLSQHTTQFPAHAVRAVYREIMSACLALQEPLSVAYLGPQGTFSQTAAHARFGLAARYVESTSILGVFEAVAREEVRYGVVPVENSSEGSVSDALDGLLHHDACIVGELELDVMQSLLSSAKSLTEVDTVYSHSQALGQCRQWLARNLPSARLVQTPSTAIAVREAATAPRSAAIASRLAGELGGLPVLREPVNDDHDNRTRFVVLGQKGAARTGHDKTTLAFSIQDGQGALWRVLKMFDDAAINLTRIHSRPSHKKAWDYVFFVDLEGHAEDPAVARLLTELGQSCPMVRKLGSYPRA